ncbi:MAG: VWA domain-containing protein [Verrucomicrobiales bacterium]|nr:VWA domain-containing protein [Verrucomicrobiales bacterium]
MLRPFTDPESLLALGVVLPLLALGFARTLADRPRGLLWAAFACRVMAALLLIVGLANPHRRQPMPGRQVLFLLDVSASVDLEAVEQELAEIETAMKDLRSRGQGTELYALAQGLRRVEVADLRQWITLWKKGAGDTDFRSASSLAEGLRAARLALPADRAARLVLCSDAVPTGDAASAAVEQLRTEGVEVRFRPLAAQRAAEAAVVSFQPAAQAAFEGEVMRFSAVIQANQSMPSRVRLTHQGVVFAEKKLTLTADDAGTRVEFDAPMSVSGPAVWGVEIVPEKDQYTVNNRRQAVVRVRGKPRLLILHEPPSAMQALAQALRAQRFEVDVRPHRGLPARLEELAAFDAVVLSNIPASVLPAARLDLLRQYVADLGGGLAMLGSDNSFGLGGYHRTPVEEVLPLVSRFEKETEKPSMALALVIDKSGSMSGQPIALARQAAKMAVELLSARDQAAVIGFDSEPQVICGMTSASDVGTLQAAIDSLDSGGGTDLFPALSSAGEMLALSSARIKHVIVLSDGQTPEADYLSLTQRIADQGATVSTIALGADAARELLRAISEAGRGRYYETVDPSTVPQIFTRETLQASRGAIQEDLFLPVANFDHPLMAGLSPGTDLPPILGYVMTQAKPASELLLQVENGDPLLAYGRFGLGAGLAYTSDLTEAWGPEWLAWEQAGTFWAQIFRGILRRQESPGLAISSEVSPSGEWHVTLRQDRNAESEPTRPSRWTGQLAEGDAAPQSVPVEETGLGRFELHLPIDPTPTHEGTASLRLRDLDTGELAVRYHQATYPPEYQLRTTPDAALTTLPRADLSRADADLAAVTAPQSLRPLLWLTALAFLLLGVFLRRV